MYETYIHSDTVSLFFNIRWYKLMGKDRKTIQVNDITSQEDKP